MKHAPSIMNIGVSTLLFVSVSCQQESRTGETWYLTGPDSSLVVKKVLEATDAWARANVEWEKRDVLPLSHKTAVLFSRFYFCAKFKNGSVYQARSYITALFVNLDGKWKIRQGHESYRVLSNK